MNWINNDDYKYLKNAGDHNKKSYIELANEWAWQGEAKLRRQCWFDDKAE